MHFLPPAQPSPTGPVLLTGATGFLGMELLARYLERTDRVVYALVRAADDAEAQARLRAAVATVVAAPGRYDHRVLAIRGDVALPGLGLRRSTRVALAETVTEIVHAAASVSFTLPLPDAREINVEGTHRLLELAQLCRARGSLRRFSHISTAYVAGDRVGVFHEDELDAGQGFRNSYEQTKHEAETLVRAHGPPADPGLPPEHRRRRARDRLDRGLGIAPPALPDYFGRLVDFAETSHWGRRRVTRVEAVGAEHRRAALAAPSAALREAVAARAG